MYNLPWNERFTATVTPNVDDSTRHALRELLREELRRPEYAETWKASTHYQTKSIWQYNWLSDREKLDRIANYAAYGILSLTGDAWVVEKASKEIYWHEGDMFPQRHNEESIECMAAGTFPRRIKAIAHKVYGIDLRTEFLATFGERARRGLAREDVTYYARLTNVIDWCAGKFGDSGSCYWDDRSGAKAMITGAGGGALTIYADADYREGQARCWIIPHGAGFAIFNSYGPVRLEQMARILADHLHLIYNRVELANNGEESGTLYINADGYYLHPEGTEELDSIDFEIGASYATCEYCGEDLDEDDTYRDPDGDALCEDCWNARYVSCHVCDNTIDQEYAIYNNSNGEYYCERCASRQDVYSCDDCGDYYSLDDLTTTADEQLLCEGCLSQHYTRCNACNEYHPDREVEQVDGYDYCPNCIEDETSVCADCGDSIRNCNAEDWDGDTVCTTCFDQRKEKELAAESGD